MKSVTLSTGDVYFENIARDIKIVSSVKFDAVKKNWYFILDTEGRECINFSSEEQAKKDHEKLLLFISQCENKKEVINE